MQQARPHGRFALAGKRIEDYGLIGNMLSAALVGRDGSIDWLCLPRFDSAACFAALLGGAEHGRWSIAPAAVGAQSVTRRYLPQTAVLESTFTTDSGEVTLTDFMPLSEDESKVDVVRIVGGVRGEVPMKMELVLRFNYGRAVPWVRRRDYGLSAVVGPDAVELHTDVPLEGHDFTTTASFTVREGETVPLTLSYHRSHEAPHFVPDHIESLERTIEWWREWCAHCRFECDNETWKQAVERSLITLKLLTFAPTGGIVAAPTTSLPEAIGGTVGLAVTGTLRNPQSEVFSMPALSESEALARLVTGRSLQSAGEADAEAIERAALGLGIRRALPGLERIGENLGLDEFGVDSGSGGESAIVAGRQLGEDVYLRYKYGLFDDFAGLELIYRISQRFRLRTETGTAQSVDLLYERNRDENAPLAETESAFDGVEPQGSPGQPAAAEPQ